jgi:hypothetical protein
MSQRLKPELNFGQTEAAYSNAIEGIAVAVPQRPSEHRMGYIRHISAPLRYMAFSARQAAPMAGLAALLALAQWWSAPLNLQHAPATLDKIAYWVLFAGFYIVLGVAALRSTFVGIALFMAAVATQAIAGATAAHHMMVLACLALGLRGAAMFFNAPAVQYRDAYRTRRYWGDNGGQAPTHRIEMVRPSYAECDE